MTQKESVTLRDLIALQNESNQRLKEVDEKITAIKLEMAHWKIKAVVYSAIVAAIVSLIISLGIRISSIVPELFKLL